MRAIFVCAVLLIPSLALAGPADSSGDAKSKDDPPAERIKKTLDKVMDIDIENQSLQMAFAQLKEQTKINFVLDTTVVSMMGIDTSNTPVNLKAPKKKLRVALKTLLAPYNLTFGIVGETVVISTEDMVVYRQLKQKVMLDLDKKPFAGALKQLGRETGVNVVVDSRVKNEADSPVTLQLEDVPLESAIRLLSEMASLKPVRVGNVLFVTTKASAQEMRGEADLAPNPMPVNPQQAEMMMMMGGGARMFVAPGIGAVPAIAPPAPPTEAPPKAADKKDEKPDDEELPKPPEKKDAKPKDDKK